MEGGRGKRGEAECGGRGTVKGEEGLWRQEREREEEEGRGKRGEAASGEGRTVERERQVKDERGWKGGWQWSRKWW